MKVLGAVKRVMSYDIGIKMSVNADSHKNSHTWVWRREGRPAKSLKRLVGAAGFEPATPGSQSRCATRLRYAPTRRGKPITRTF